LYFIKIGNTSEGEPVVLEAIRSPVFYSVWKLVLVDCTISNLSTLTIFVPLLLIFFVMGTDKILALPVLAYLIMFTNSAYHTMKTREFMQSHNPNMAVKGKATLCFHDLSYPADWCLIQTNP
jgi:hypothetical protein